MSTEYDSARKALDDLREQLNRIPKPIRVLLVEDNPTDAKLAEAAMQEYGVEVDTVGTVSEASSQIAADKFQVVLIDLVLGGSSSGLDVLNYMALAKSPAIPIIITGMMEGSEDIKKALNMGAKFVIQKPLTYTHLKVLFGTL